MIMKKPILSRPHDRTRQAYRNWIAFISFRDGNNEIYIIHPDGTDLTRFTNNSISDWQPRWGN